MSKPPMPNDVWAAYFVALLAQEIHLPTGTLWEPGMVKWVTELLKTHNRLQVGNIVRPQLGLQPYTEDNDVT